MKLNHGKLFSRKVTPEVQAIPGTREGAEAVERCVRADGRRAVERIVDKPAGKRACSA